MTKPENTTVTNLDPISKESLLRLSESIVDQIDIIESADEQTELHKVHKASKKLHHIGDELLDLRQVAQGDDLTYINFMLGSVCYQLGYLEKSKEAYEAALIDWPDHVGLLNEYFLALTDLGDLPKAYEVILLSIKHGGETPDVLQNMATVLARMGRIAEAKAVLFNCMSKFPDDIQSQQLLAELDNNFTP